MGRFNTHRLLVAHSMMLDAKKGHARVLLLLSKEGPLRFSEIERGTGLKPMQVDRALKALVQGRLVLPETIPGPAYPVKVRYSLTKRGAAEVRALAAYVQELERAAKDVSIPGLQDLRPLFR